MYRDAADGRLGGRLLVESLEAVGCRAAFGVPGIHALSLWDALADSVVRYVGMRTELTAGFAADGYARAGGRPAAVVTTTGPGAIIGAAGLVEPRMSYVPVVNIATQVPRALIGSGRGNIHELAEQSEILSALAKWHAVAREVGELPELVREAFRQSLTAPQGPVVLEVPCDLLTEQTAIPAPAAVELDSTSPAPTEAALAEAAALLAASERPVMWAGGGVLRSGAAAAFTALAERLDAPAVTTYMGKGAIPADHPLSAGSACYEGAVMDLLRTADVVLAVGTELGEMATNQWTLTFEGRLIQVDVRSEHIGRSYPDALGVVGDAAAVLEGLASRVPTASRGGASRARAAHDRIAEGHAGQGREAEFALLRSIREALPRGGIVAWDMTISGYIAAPFYPVYEPGTWLYPLGSGTLGYAWPAAIGAKVAQPHRDVLAVHGDGGVLYGLLELLTARQESIGAKLLIVDDEGYGILRLIQEAAYGRTIGVDLHQPDFPALVRSLGVPVHEAVPGHLDAPLRAALAEAGPSVVHLPQQLVTPGRTP